MDLKKPTDIPGPAEPSRPGPSAPAAADGGARREERVARRWISRTFRWHLLAFAAVNAGLTATNIATGRGWWSLWPLLATGAALGLHYLGYKAVTVDERWADERVEELNLKSYDRGHIEALKSRYKADAPPPPARDKGAR